MNITLTKPEIDLIAKALTLLSCVIDDSLKVAVRHGESLEDPHNRRAARERDRAREVADQMVTRIALTLRPES